MAMLNDLRYALRTLSANRLFAAMAILSLALGIGANTAIYSFMDAILVRTLPIQNPESLVALQWHAKDGAGDRAQHQRVDVERSRARPGQPQSAVAGFRGARQGQSRALACGGVPKHVPDHGGDPGPGNAGRRTCIARGGFFGALGTPPSAGRLFGPDDDREGTSPVAVVSYGFAQRRFGERRNRLSGQTAIVNDTPFTIVGVTHPGFPGIAPGQRA